MKMLTDLLLRDISIAFRHRGAWLNPLAFAVMVITLFSFGVGPDAVALKSQGSAIVWVVALLGIMLSLESMFSHDFNDGSLEQMLMADCSAYALALTKVCAHWIVVGLPLALASPLFALMLGLPARVIPVMALGLVLGTGILCFLGAVGASVAMSLRSGSNIIALVVLPFYIPVIIFGARLFQSALNDWPVMPGFALLTGLLIVVASLGPLAVGAGLRFSVEQ